LPGLLRTIRWRGSSTAARTASSPRRCRWWRSWTGRAIAALIGHCSRRNAQVAALQADPRAQVLFMGPQGYVSPALVSRPQWAPTWNFAVAVFAVTVAFDDPGTMPAVRRLTDHVEAGQEQPWRIEQAGDRLPHLMARIIGFRATVTASDARFKLGQEEDLELLEILSGHADPALVGWMRRLNADRLHEQVAPHGEHRIAEPGDP
jgi:transcriptional regulator